MESLDKPLATFYTLLNDFVQRQHLVVQVMEAIRPDLLNGFPGKGLKPRPSKTYIKDTQSGLWTTETGDSWKYHFHGAGCRLTNSVTDEPIEWNSPIEWKALEPINFDPYWFVNWIIWKLEHMNEDAAYQGDMNFLKIQLGNTLEEVRKNSFELLSELAARGLLTYHAGRTDMYTLQSKSR